METGLMENTKKVLDFLRTLLCNGNEGLKISLCEVILEIALNS